jgi:oligoribonuclease
LIITSDDLVEIWRTSKVCRFLGDLDKIDPVVREMHQASGLWAECVATEETTFSVESALVALFPTGLLIIPGLVLSLEKMSLCGSNIGFDRSFLREHMPRLLDCFHYRSIDVSTLTELAKRWFPSVYETRPGADTKSSHRVLPDLECSIALLKYYRETMFRAGRITEERRCAKCRMPLALCVCMGGPR